MTGNFYSPANLTLTKTVAYTAAGDDIEVHIDGSQTPSNVMSHGTSGSTETTTWATAGVDGARQVKIIRDTGTPSLPEVTRSVYEGDDMLSLVKVSSVTRVFEPSSYSSDGWRVKSVTRHGSPDLVTSYTYQDGSDDEILLRSTNDGSWTWTSDGIPAAITGDLVSPGAGYGYVSQETNCHARPWLDGAAPSGQSDPTASASVIEVTRQFWDEGNGGSLEIRQTFTGGNPSGQTDTESFIDGADNYEKTIVTEYSEGGESIASETWRHTASTSTNWEGYLYRTISPEGVYTTYSYERMSESGGVYSQDAQGDLTATYATQGTSGSEGGVLDGGKTLTTRTLTIRNQEGRILRRQVQAYTGGGNYEAMTTTDYEYVLAGNGAVTKTTVKRDGRTVSVEQDTGTREVTFTDEAGAVTVETRDHIDRLKSRVQEAGGGVGALTTTWDYDGLTTTVTRSAPGVNSLSTSTTRDLRGQTVEMVDEAGTVTTYARNHGARTETATTNGVTRVTTRHADGRIKEVGGSGVVPTYTNHSIDADGFITTTTEVGTSSRWTKQKTDWLGRVVEHKRPAAPKRSGTNSNLVMTNTYDEATGRLAQTSWSTSQAPTVHTYDALGTETTSGLDLTGADDHLTTTKRYYEKTGNDWWQVQHTTRPIDDTNDLTQTTRTLMSVGSKEETVASNQTQWESTTTRTFNPGTKTVTTTTVSPAGTTTTITVNGLVQSRTLPGGGQTESYTYDGHRRLVRSTDTRGSTTWRAYDEAGRVATTTVQLGGTTRYTYYPATHQNAGMLHTITDNGGGQTVREYDALGRVTEITGDAEYRRTFSYNAYGELATLTTYGDETATTTWTHDAATGLLTRKQYHDGEGTDYGYTEDWRLGQREWARGITTTYSYNSAGDLTGISYDDSATPDVTFSNFDRLGRPKTVNETLGSTSDETTLAYNVDSGAVTTTYASGHSMLPRISLVADDDDDYGRPTGHTARQDGSFLHGWAWAYGTSGDAEGRLQTISTIPNGPLATLGYYPGTGLLQEQEVTLGQDTILTRDHHLDMAGRTYGVVNEAPDGGGMRTVGAIAHEYDARQRRTTGRREDGTIWHYGYNDRSEVTSADKRLDDGSLVPSLNFGYNYDGIGNRTAASFGRPTEATIAYTQDTSGLNQYASISNPGRADILVRSDSEVSMAANGASMSVTSLDDLYAGEISLESGTYAQGDWVDVAVGGTGVGDKWIPPETENLVYDLDGNLTSDGRWGYTWDGENRLIEVSTLQNAISAGAPDIVVSYTYDWRSRRIGRTQEDNGIITSRTRYLYDDWNVVAEFDAAPITGNLTASATYTWSLDLSGTPQGAGGVGGLLSVELIDGAGSSLYLPSYDANGNIIAWTDDAGELKQRRDYDPFGNPVIVENVSMTANHAARLSYGFSTKPRDAATGFVYYGMRFLDTNRGRWLNRDPIGERGGMNVYGLLRNSSVSQVDRLGLWKITRVGTKRWAEAVSEQGDTLAQLAREIGLGVEDIKSWAKLDIDYPVGTPNWEYPAGCIVRIPNVFAYYASDIQRPASDPVGALREFFNANSPANGIASVRRQLLEKIEELRAEGFYMVGLLPGDRAADFISLWEEEGIWGIAFAGHGPAGEVAAGWEYYGFRARDASSSDYEDVTPQQVSPPYGLAYIGGFTCFSAQLIKWPFGPYGNDTSYWSMHISSHGEFEGYMGAVGFFGGDPVFRFGAPPVYP